MPISRRNFIKKASLSAIGCAPAIDALAKIIGTDPSTTYQLISYSCRLNVFQSMLNLDFFFINAFPDRNVLRATYSQKEAYMIVRLPQQHIAEEYKDMSVPEICPTRDKEKKAEEKEKNKKDEECRTCVFDDTAAPCPDFHAQTRIAGYSYLAFRIMFDKNDSTVVRLHESDLLDWNNDSKYRLVVRRNLRESLFHLTVNSPTDPKGHFQNSYPLGYRATSYTYDHEFFPKAYGAPVTAIEAPWRLILSPALPDQNKYRFKWEFSKKPSKDSNIAELWMATLTTELRKQAKSDDRYETVDAEKTLGTTENELVRQLDIMFLGSPDHLADKKVDPSIKIRDPFQVLPGWNDKSELVELFIKYKLVAKASRLAFSPLGLSTQIDFKNTLYDEINKDEQKISLFSYKQLISFGRDEEVNVVRLFMEKELGTKMLLVETTKRRTKGGISYLDYREYIMPLETEKDYQNHSDDEERSKFNAPFKKIRFLDLDPKRICPLGNKSTGILNPAYGPATKNANLILSDKTQWEGIYYPQIPNEPCGTKPVTFEIELTDWHDQTHKIRKSIQAVTVGINDRLVKKDITLEEIDTFFSSDTETFEKEWSAINIQYRELITFAQASNSNASLDIVEQVGRVKATMLQGLSGFLNELTSGLRTFQTSFIKQVEKMQSILNTLQADFDSFVKGERDRQLAEYPGQITAARAKISTKLSEVNKSLQAEKKQIESFSGDIKDPIDYLAKDLDVHIPKSTLLYKSIKGHLDKLREIYQKISSIALKLELAVPNDDKVVAYIQSIVTYFEKDFLDDLKALDSIFTDEENGATGLSNNLDEVAKRYPKVKITVWRAKVEQIYSFRTRISTEVPTAIGFQVVPIYKNLIETINGLEASLLQLKADFKVVEDSVSATLNELRQNFYDAVSDFRARCAKVRERTDSLLALIATHGFPSISEAIKHLSTNADTFDDLEKEISDINEKLKSNIVTAKFYASEQLEVLKSQVLAEYKALTFGYVALFAKVPAATLTEIRNKVVDLIQRIEIGIGKNYLDLKNAILTERAKIGYALNKLKDDAEDFINEELSVLETDFIVLHGALKTKVDKTIDFFNQYASIPQLKHAQVYIPAICKMVNEDFAVGIKFAQDYYRNQVDLVNLEIQKNKSRVFAEIKDSSIHMIQGKIRNISAELGGIINPELPTGYITYLRDKKREVQEAFADSEIAAQVRKGEEAIRTAKKEYEAARQKVNDAIAEASAELETRKKELDESLAKYKNAVKQIPQDLILLGKEAKTQWDSIQSFDPQTFFKDLEAKVLGSIPLMDILGIDFEPPRLSPSRDQITYNFITKKLKSKDFSLFRFERTEGTQLQVYLAKKLTDRSYNSFIKLNNFNVVIRVSSEAILLIKFQEFQFKSSNVKSKDVSVKIDGVAFGGPLDFFGKLADKIKMPGSGLRIVPSLSQLEVGYSFPIPGIEAPAFSFTNLKFDVALKIGFATSSDVKPLLLELGINRPNDKFLIAVGIFGGRGHFVMSASPHKLEKIDAAIEFGGYIGINLGIAAGHVFLFAGIRMVFESTGDITLVGYVICEGGVTVFGFISIYLTVELSMTYRRMGGEASLYGSASLSYSVSIGFFKKSFTVSFSKQIAGSKGKSVDSAGSQASISKERTTYYATADSSFDDFELVEDVTPSGDQEQADQDNTSFKKTFTYQQWKEYCDCFELV